MSDPNSTPEPDYPATEPDGQPVENPSGLQSGAPQSGAPQGGSAQGDDHGSQDDSDDASGGAPEPA